MTDFLQMIAGGIAVGSSYALMGLAMVIIYKTSEVVNFAQGEMALLSIFLTYMVLEFHGFPYFVAFPAALLFAVFLGCFLEMILMGFVSWKFGADPKTMPFPMSPYSSVTLGEVFVSGLEVLTFIVALTVMVILFLFFRYSKLGVAMKATQQNQVAARLMGIRTKRILMITWGISSLVGCLAGLLIAPTTMQPYMMWDPMLKGFAAAVLGGMTSLPGSVFGAYIIGLVENLFGGYISIEFKSVVAFAIIVLVLCVKPSGLFTRHYVKKV
jgi:branched-chain amino acid transport system permease protein